MWFSHRACWYWSIKEGHRERLFGFAAAILVQLTRAARTLVIRVGHSSPPNLRSSSFKHRTFSRFVRKEFDLLWRIPDKAATRLPPRFLRSGSATKRSAPSNIVLFKSDLTDSINWNRATRLVVRSGDS